MTVSTEDTRNSMDDGAIGKSYLWIIKNITTKKRWKAVNPDKIIDLDAADARFRGQKIESVCITKETNKSLYLTLVADNDDGTSSLFRLVIPNKWECLYQQVSRLFFILPGLVDAQAVFAFHGVFMATSHKDSFTNYTQQDKLKPFVEHNTSKAPFTIRRCPYRPPITQHLHRKLNEAAGL